MGLEMSGFADARPVAQFGRIRSTGEPPWLATGRMNSMICRQWQCTHVAQNLQLIRLRVMPMQSNYHVRKLCES